MRWAALALLLAGCAQPMVRTAPQPELPPIPSQVLSQLGPVPVVWVDSIVNGEGQSMSGGFHTLRRAIFLRTDLKKNPTVAWLVLEHEKCHVWSLDSGIAALLSDSTQQALCDAVAAYRVAEMLQGRRK